MAYPTSPVRGYSFTGFQTTNPATPLPADKVDQEIDRSNTAIDSLITFIQTVIRSDGNLANGIVTSDSFATGLFDSITADLTAQLTPYVDDALAYATSAASSASSAASSATSAQTYNANASNAASNAASSATSASTSASSAQTSATTATNKATAASNSANSAAGDAAAASLSEATAYNWAEKLDGPVVQLDPGNLVPEAVDDGLWSSKWWAIRCAKIYQNITGAEFSNLWYGARASDPTASATGGAVPSGAIYYNTTSDEFRAYDGSVWHAFAVLDSAVLISFDPSGTNLGSTNVQAALAELDVDLSAHIATFNAHVATFDSHTHTASEITDFTSAVQGVGDPRYAALSHTHTASEITDFSTAVQAVGDPLYAPISHTHTASEITDFTSAVQGVGDARYARTTGNVTLNGDLTVQSTAPILRLTDTDGTGLPDYNAWELRGLNGVPAIWFYNGGTFADKPYEITRDVNGAVQHLFQVQNTAAAVIEAAGTSVPSTTSLITREKGDNRYAQLDTSPVFVGQVTAANLIASTGNVYTKQQNASTNCHYWFQRQDGTLSGVLYKDQSTVNELRFLHYEITGTTSTLSLTLNDTDGLLSYTSAPPATTSLINRARGDARYTLSSTARFKEEIVPADPPPGLFSLGTYAFTYGGELPEDDPRRGRRSFGVLAEELAEVMPEAVLNDDEDRPERIDLGPVVMALLAEIKSLRARVTALEGAH